jgi:hypothetical protein
MAVKDNKCKLGFPSEIVNGEYSRPTGLCPRPECREDLIEAFQVATIRKGIEHR